MPDTPKLPSYGYGKGLISNSMIQAAIVCPLKFQRMYVDRDFTKDGKWFDETWVGSIVHHVLEHHDENPDAAIAAAWDLVEAYIPFRQRSENLYTHWKSARKATLDNGAKWGTIYKAPEMTSFWKKTYSGLNTLIDTLNHEVAASGAVFDPGFTYFQAVCRIMLSLENWFTMPHGLCIRREVKVSMDGFVGTIDRLEIVEHGKYEHIVCDYKTGSWGYKPSDLINDDQLLGYARLLNMKEGYNVTHLKIYDLFVNNIVVVPITEKMATAYAFRLSTNQAYAEHIRDLQILAPIPAGMKFKIGCPCIIGELGECPAYIGPTKGDKHD